MKEGLVCSAKIFVGLSTCCYGVPFTLGLVMITSWWLDLEMPWIFGLLVPFVVYTLFTLFLTVIAVIVNFKPTKEPQPPTDLWM